ncbi:MAG: type II toxin-antitoxin system Phd/YefM family antitoxin [Lachnospiraceae bacterium]|nr:type II toxin-antitoxin system Phd/YefM family antitoxin [Lachnospiraceae bacterium]
MLVETNQILSVTEANKNFSRAARMAEANGQVVIFKNNRPKYVLYDLDSSPQIEMTEDEKIDFVAARILRKYKEAFLELAK